MLLYEKYSSFIFYHISLLITHFNEWNTPQTKKLSSSEHDIKNIIYSCYITSYTQFYKHDLNKHIILLNTPR